MAHTGRCDLRLEKDSQDGEAWGSGLLPLLRARHAHPRWSQSGPISSGELALVLFEDNEVGISYLRGRYLAEALQRMVNKGLMVTFVLDRCFSGSVVRHNDWQSFDVRSLSYNPDVDAVNPQESETNLLDLGSTLRDPQFERD